MARQPCGRPIKVQKSQGPATVPCPRERGKGIQRCRWHWLMAQTPDIQAAWADARRSKAPEPHRARVPSEEWPDGERWCAGCQSFVPLFYATGSRCKSCASRAAHASRVKSVYGITQDEYDELFEFQGGRCFICRRRPGKIRLAVDHDHQTNEVRGLLCANNENGCNRAIIGNLEGAAGGGLAAARRVVEYLEHPPYARLRGQEERERIVLGLRETPGDAVSAPLPAQDAPRDPWGPARPPPPF